VSDHRIINTLAQALGECARVEGIARARILMTPPQEALLIVRAAYIDIIAELEMVRERLAIAEESLGLAHALLERSELGEVEAGSEES
jgi:hypothetical protein